MLAVSSTSDCNDVGSSNCYHKYDIRDIANGTIQGLTAQERLMYLKHHFVPDTKYIFATQTLQKDGGGKKRCKISAQLAPEIQIACL